MWPWKESWGRGQAVRWRMMVPSAATEQTLANDHVVGGGYEER